MLGDADDFTLEGGGEGLGLDIGGGPVGELTFDHGDLAVGFDFDGVGAVAGDDCCGVCGFEVVVDFGSDVAGEGAQPDQPFLVLGVGREVFDLNEPVIVLFSVEEDDAGGDGPLPGPFSA